MRTFSRTLIAAIAVPALVLTAAGCGDDDNPVQSENSASQASIDDLSARVERNEQMYGILTLATLGLHGMDETLNGEKTIDPTFIRNTRTAVRVLALTDWGEFQADADAVRVHGEDLMAALNDEDVDAAGAAAAELHDSEHDFSAEVWNSVAADLDPAFGGPDEHDEAPAENETPAAEEAPATDETPTAGETPAAGATP